MTYVKIKINDLVDLTNASKESEDTFTLRGRVHELEDSVDQRDNDIDALKNRVYSLENENRNLKQTLESRERVIKTILETTTHGRMIQVNKDIRVTELEHALALNGNKVIAILVVRERLGLGLAEAKRMIDAVVNVPAALVD